MFGVLSADFLIPTGFLIVVLSGILFGIAVLFLGRRLSRQGDWLAAFGVILLLAWVVLSWGVDQQWLVGWVWPKQEAISLQIGLFTDVLGSTLTFVAAFLGLILLFNRKTSADRSPLRMERQYAAASLSVTGVAICWYALTPWLVFVGLGITFFGGVIALAASWHEDSDASIVASFIKERVASLTLMVIGASALASLGVPLQFAQTETIKAWDFSQASEAHVVAAGILLLGWLLAVIPFPYLSYLGKSSSVLPVSRITFAHLFPSWGAFAILYRLYPQLQASEELPYFGWFALSASVLSAIMGILQSNWKQSLNCWLASAMGFSAASLLICGPTVAFACLICQGLAACMLALSGAGLDEAELEGKTSKAKTRKEITTTTQTKATWAKVAAFFGAAVGTGMIGFASCFGIIHTLSGALADPPLAVAFGVVIFFSSTLMFRLALQQAQLSPATSSTWFSVLSPYLVMLLTFGVLWTGSITGGALPAGMDLIEVMTIWDLPAQLNPKLLALEESRFLTASWIHWGVLFISAAVAYWITRKDQDGVRGIHESFPKLSTFISGGYGVSQALSHTFSAIHWTGGTLERGIDGKFWDQLIPKAFKLSLDFLGRMGATLDQFLTVRINSGVRLLVDVPAKMLQLIHNGDVQWYLFFAIASGIAVLIHFLRF